MSAMQLSSRLQRAVVRPSSLATFARQQSQHSFRATQQLSSLSPAIGNRFPLSQQDRAFSAAAVEAAAVSKADSGKKADHDQKAKLFKPLFWIPLGLFGGFGSYSAFDIASRAPETPEQLRRKKSRADVREMRYNSLHEYFQYISGGAWEKDHVNMRKGHHDKDQVGKDISDRTWNRANETHIRQPSRNPWKPGSDVNTQMRINSGRTKVPGVVYEDDQK